MKFQLSLSTLRLLMALALASSGALQAATTHAAATNAAPIASSTHAAPPATNTLTLTNGAPSTNAVPSGMNAPSVKSDDDDDDNFSIKVGHPTHDQTYHVLSSLEDDLVPLAGIAASFGTPLLIVFCFFFFRFRRRQETLRTVREYLAQGKPVPPELLSNANDGGSRGSAFLSEASVQARLDLRRGLKLTFIGLAISLALLVDSPHHRNWCWGLLPMVIGIGYVVLGMVERRDSRESNNRVGTVPPPNRD